MKTNLPFGAGDVSMNYVDQTPSGHGGISFTIGHPCADGSAAVRFYRSGTLPNGHGVYDSITSFPGCAAN